MSNDNVVQYDAEPAREFVMEFEVIHNTDEEVSNRDPEDETLSGLVNTEDESNLTPPADNEIFMASTQKRNIEDLEEKDTQDSKKRKYSEECEDDARLCTICLDNWNNTGKHMMCALKCGHLFGRSCIMRWISTNKTCPSCKEKASKRDIRIIYANKLIANDIADLEILKKQLELAVQDRNLIQIDLTRAICKEEMLVQEIMEYKQKIKILNTLNDGLSKSQSFSSNKSQKDFLLIQHTDSFQICQQGSCRVMDIHPHTGKFVISLKSPNNECQGFGIRMYNIENMAAIAYTPLHSKQIRDLKFNHTNTCLLSVSLDKSAKITDINSNSSICRYFEDNMLWSCCWDSSQQHIFYVGEEQGSIFKFDLRYMKELVDTYKINNDLSPVVSLVPIPSYPGSVMPLGGFIACKLNSTWAFENTGNGYTRNIVPIDGPFNHMSYNSEFSQLLISAGPNSREPYTRHIVCTLEKYNDTMLKCNSVNTFCGGLLQKQLSRSCFIQNMKDQNTYIAAQKDHYLMVWSVNNENACSALSTFCPVVDLMPLNNTKGSHLLALSEKQLDFYKFYDSS